MNPHIIMATSFRPQRGAVLVVCLVLLLILTILGLSSVGNVNLQTQMARNTQFSQEVFHLVQSEMKYQMERVKFDAMQLGGLDKFHQTVVDAAGAEVALPESDVAFDNLAWTQGVTMPVTVSLQGTPYEVPQGTNSGVVGCGGASIIYRFRITVNAVVTGTPYGSNQEVGYFVCPP